MAGSIDQVQLVQVPIASAVVKADGVRLDRNTPLALEVHGIEHLVGHFPFRKRTRDFQHPVGQGGLAVVNMGHNRKVANVTRVRHKRILDFRFWILDYKPCAAPSLFNPKSKIQNILPFENLAKGRYPVKLGVGAGVDDVGLASLSKRRSFPRKRESTPQTFGNALPRDWIPAFAGMTATCNARVPQMTPVPRGAQYGFR